MSPSVPHLPPHRSARRCHEHEPRSAGRSRALVFALTLVILASLALNLWYASAGLDGGRHWDERFSLANVRKLMMTGWIRPANGWYQSLSYLPQTALLATSEALHRWTGVERLAVVDADWTFTSTAYFLSRLLQTLYGATCLLMVFLVGRRLWSPVTGILGAFFLAVVPWFVQTSSIYKPDILVMLCGLLAVWCSLRAVERPTLRRFAVAGCAVALTMSAKLNGALACAPVVAAALLSEGRWRQRAARLLSGGAAAVALFAVLNPYFTIYPAYLARNLDAYAVRGTRQGSTHLGVLWRQMDLVVSWNGHGALVGTLALVGVAGLTFHLLRRSRAFSREVSEAWVFLSFPLSYSLMWAAVTSGFRDNNFLPVLPFTALLAAWAAVHAWQLAAERLPVLRSWGARLPAVALLGAVVLPAPFLYVYRPLIPTTDEEAQKFLQRQFDRRGDPSVRLIYREGDPTPERRSEAGLRPVRSEMALATVDRLDRLSGTRLDASDGEIFPASRLDGEDADAYLRRLSALSPGAMRRFSPRPFAARGRTLVAVSHPWRLTGKPRVLDLRRSARDPAIRVLRLPPGLVPGEVISFRVIGTGPEGTPRLEVGSRQVPLYELAWPRRPPQYLSERVRLDEKRPRVRLVGAAETVLEPSRVVELLRWEPPAVSPQE